MVAVLIVGWLLLSGGDIPLVDDGPSGPSSFSFELAGNVRLSSTSQTPPAELAGAARNAGDGVKETMDELYFRAFLDTDSWGDYADAFALFDTQAAARAQADTEVLTLGSTAGETFDSVRPTSGELAISVLMDKDKPATAVAEVEFLADATRSDGGTTAIASSGSYYLRQVDGAWRVFAYDVDRDDTTAAAPSPTGSPS
ncbi:MAG TPA: hypothetical protein VFZ75_08320 [Actinomycetota bacterium]|nr:hypothetical protein [Actinomycetota bacterium]